MCSMDWQESSLAFYMLVADYTDVGCMQDAGAKRYMCSTRAQHQPASH